MTRPQNAPGTPLADQGGSVGSSFHRWSTGELSNGGCGCYQEEEGQLQAMVRGWGRWYTVESVTIERLFAWPCSYESKVREVFADRFTSPVRTPRNGRASDLRFLSLGTDREARHLSLFPLLFHAPRWPKGSCVLVAVPRFLSLVQGRIRARCIRWRSRRWRNWASTSANKPDTGQRVSRNLTMPLRWTWFR